MCNISHNICIFPWNQLKIALLWIKYSSTEWKKCFVISVLTCKLFSPLILLTLLYLVMNFKLCGHLYGTLSVHGTSECTEHHWYNNSLWLIQHYLFKSKIKKNKFEGHFISLCLFYVPSFLHTSTPMPSLFHILSPKIHPIPLTLSLNDMPKVQ